MSQIRLDSGARHGLYAEEREFKVARKLSFSKSPVLTVPKPNNKGAVRLSEEGAQTAWTLRSRMETKTEVPKENHPAKAAKTILLVDDNADVRVPTKWFLNNFGYAVDSVCSAEEGLALFDPKLHDLVITDNSMPGMSGSEMAHVIKLRSPGTLVVMYTGLPPEDRSCLDLVVQRPTHLLKLKDAIDGLVASQSPP
jgi:CheY-like chemotaxis protein